MRYCFLVIAIGLRFYRLAYYQVSASLALGNVLRSGLGASPCNQAIMRTAFSSLFFAAKKPATKTINYKAAAYGGVTKLCQYWSFNFKHRTSHKLNVLSVGIFFNKISGCILRNVPGS